MHKFLNVYAFKQFNLKLNVNTFLDFESSFNVLSLTTADVIIGSFCEFKQCPGSVKIHLLM